MSSFDNIRAVDQYTPKNLRVEEELDALGLPKPPKGTHELDKEETRKKFYKVYQWWNQARWALSESRTQAIRDHDIFDGIQWLPEDIEQLIKRGQLPLTFNKIKPAVDWILGTEKRTRIDYKILPREENDADMAEIKTDLFKYVIDVNNAEFKRSQAFVDAVISGVGWLECGVNDNPDEEKVFYRYEDWRNVWYDHMSVEMDMADARYIFRAKWIDLDVAITLFPDRADVIKGSANSILDRYDTAYRNESQAFYDDAMINTMFGYQADSNGIIGERERVFIVEAWYKTPAKQTVLRGKKLGVYNGIEFDENNPNHQIIVQSGIAQPVENIRMQVRQMIFCGSYVLQDIQSPYRHNKFPFIPIWGFKRKKNNTTYGIVRNLRDPQDDLNKRRTKALHILASNKVIAEKSAVDDWVEFAIQANKPDGIMIVEDNKIKSIEIKNDTSLAQEHVLLMQQDEKYIQDMSGVTDELMGKDTNAVSGRAISARQEQGHVVTASLFDNYRLAFKLAGEIVLSLIEQYYSEQKMIRIAGNEKVKYFNINSVDPETGETLNDITASQADFVVSEQDYNATIRKALFETMMQMLPKFDPSVSIQLLDLVMQISDLPNKKEFVDRIRKLNNQATGEEQTPEQQQEQQMQMQEQQQAAQMQQQILQTQLAEAQGKVQAQAAQAQKTVKEAQLIDAKIQTEMVQQQVLSSGIQYDQEKIRIEKAQTLNTIDQSEHKKVIEKAQTLNAIDQSEHKKNIDIEMVKAKDKQQGSTERGLKTDNQK